MTREQAKTRLLEASRSWQEQWISGDNSDGDRMATYLTELVNAYFDVPSLWDSGLPKITD
ncbi:MAG TPA: hypothetical protein VIY48_04500 [Candidatus Paceibacterota bacterium]